MACRFVASGNESCLMMPKNQPLGLGGRARNHGPCERMPFTAQTKEVCYLKGGYTRGVKMTFHGGFGTWGARKSLWEVPLELA